MLPGLDTTDTTTYLGPARVLSLAPLRARLEEGDPREVSVRVAFAYPFAPEVGDELLLLGQRDDAFYAVGVLNARPRSSLEVPGDLDVRAVGGTLRLQGDLQLEVESPEVTLRGQRLRTFADSLQEHAQTVFRWVKGTLNERTGETQRVVEGEDLLLAKKAVTLAEETVRVDGSEIHLGH
ncbi:MAG: DUF3540 domain-containing protein [Planctomycetota bacterium]